MPDTEDSKHPFVATEISLLELLMAKQLQGLTVTIPEINYVLGLKDKNQGMQKKVRSDIINRINEKYSFFSQEKVSLVQNIRSETDKRFFEYHLNPEHLERLRALLSWVRKISYLYAPLKGNAGVAQLVRASDS